MFLVGGGILTHGVPVVHHWVEHVGEMTGHVAGMIVPSLLNGVFGLISGTAVLLLWSGIAKFRGKSH